MKNGIEAVLSILWMADFFLPMLYIFSNYSVVHIVLVWIIVYNNYNQQAILMQSKAIWFYKHGPLAPTAYNEPAD